MILRSIDFEDGEPAAVTVTMSLAQAAAICAVFGAMNGHAHTKLGNVDEIYETLVGGVFNPYFDDGIAEVAGRVDLKTLNDPPPLGRPIPD